MAISVSRTPYTVTVASVNGFYGNVVLATVGLPAGASPGFSQNPICLGPTPPCSLSATSTLTVTAPSASLGSFTVEVTGTSGSLSNSAASTQGVFTASASSVATVPSTGTGSSAAFTFAFSDTGGASALTAVSAMIASNAVGGANTALPASCVVTYNVAQNALALLTDLGAPPSATITPGSGSQSNSQCILTGSSSSVSQSGNVLTLNLAIGFTGAYSGNKTIYGSAQDANGSPGWQRLGAWSAPGLPSVYSMNPVTPTISPNVEQAISFELFDPIGWRDIVAFEISFGPLVNATTGDPSQAWPGGCVLNYAPTGGNYNTLYLAGDATGGPFSQSFIVQNQQAATLTNNQCSVYSSGTTVSYPEPAGQPDNLTLTALMSFTQAYATAYPGVQQVYVQAVNQANQSSGWLQVGTICVGTSCGSGSGGGSGALTNIITSVPAGLTFIVDGGGSTPGGSTCTSPCYLSWTPGTTHTFVPSSASQTISGMQYGFSSWSLGGAGNTGSAFAPTITAPGGAGGSYTASFVQQYYLTTSVSPAGAGTVTSSGLYPAGTVQVTAAPSAGYVFSEFSGALTGTDASQSLTLSAPASLVANFQPSLGKRFSFCLEESNPPSSCNIPAGTVVLPAGTYVINSTIFITGSNVTLSGGGSAANKTLLVRGPLFTGPIISVLVPSYAPPGVLLENFTICGGLDVIRDSSNQTDVHLGTSSVGCPRNQTSSPSFNTGSCGDMLHRLTVASEPGGTAALITDHLCSGDIVVQQADTGEYIANPFSSATDYSLTITNVDLEDSTSHAISLFESASNGYRINDVYINNSAINGSAVTGILYAATGAPTYSQPVCDSNSIWSNDPAVWAPRNLRIENNTFTNNNTGAMGGGAVRWVGLRNNNVFTNNYVHPQGGNTEGGTVQFDPCADQLQITNNQFYAPSTFAYNTLGLELYSRDIVIEGNKISGYPLEGIALDSAFNATVDASNTIMNNAAQFNLTGGVSVSTTQPVAGGAACGESRDSQDVTIGGNTFSGQPFGVYLSGHDTHSTATLRRNVNTYAVELSNYGAVGQDYIVYTDPPQESGVNPTLNAVGSPRALTVEAVSPVTSRCTPAAGTAPQTFAFPASDDATTAGASQIKSIEVFFSTAANIDDNTGYPGPGNGANGCHFIYSFANQAIQLDDAAGDGTFPFYSPVGPTGHSISNNYCTIYAGSTPAAMPLPFISTFISNLLLTISVPAGKSHIYTIVTDIPGLTTGMTY